MTKDEFEQWRAGPVTEEVMRLLRRKADAMENDAALGMFKQTNAPDFESIRRNAIYIRGQVDSLDFVVNTMSHDDLMLESK